MYNLSYLTRATTLTLDGLTCSDQHFDHAYAQRLVSTHLVALLDIDGLELLADDSSLSALCPDYYDLGSPWQGYALVRFPSPESGELQMTFLHITGCFTPTTFTMQVQPVGAEHTEVISRAAWEKALLAGGIIVCHAGWLDYQKQKYDYATPFLVKGVGRLLSTNSFNFVYVADSEYCQCFFNDSLHIDAVVRLCEISQKYQPHEDKTFKTFYAGDPLDDFKVIGPIVLTNEGDDSEVIGQIATAEQDAAHNLRTAIAEGTAKFKTSSSASFDRINSGDWLS